MFLQEKILKEKKLQHTDLEKYEKLFYSSLSPQIFDISSIYSSETLEVHLAL